MKAHTSSSTDDRSRLHDDRSRSQDDRSRSQDDRSRSYDDRNGNVQRATCDTLEAMETDCLTDSLKSLSLNITSADVSMMSRPYVSIDDGYFSRSINSFDAFSVDDHDDNVNVNEHNCPDGRVAFDDIRATFAQDADGDTNLIIAIIKCEETIVNWMLSLVPNQDMLNIQNKLLQTALHVAVIVRNCKLVRRLMIMAARVDVRDIHGNTPLHIACKEGYTEIVATLLQPVTYSETLTNKYQIPYQRIPQDLDLINYDGYSCLHLAALSGHLEIVGLLLSRGANVNIREHKSGRSVLHIAAENNNIALLEQLLQNRRVNVNAETYGGLTPLRLAAGRRHSHVIHLLIIAGACDEDGFSTDDE